MTPSLETRGPMSGQGSEAPTGVGIDEYRRKVAIEKARIENLALQHAEMEALSHDVAVEEAAELLAKTLEKTPPPLDEGEPKEFKEKMSSGPHKAVESETPTPLGQVQSELGEAFGTVPTEPREDIFADVPPSVTNAELERNALKAIQKARDTDPGAEKERKAA